jgi:hypothetical protein
MGRTVISSHCNPVNIGENARIYVAGGSTDHLEIHIGANENLGHLPQSIIDGIVLGNGQVVINASSDEDGISTLIIKGEVSSVCQEDLTTTHHEWVSGNVHLRAYAANLIITSSADIRAYNSIGVEASWGGRYAPLKVDINGASFHVTGTPNRLRPLCAFAIGRSNEEYAGEIKIRNIEVRCSRDTDGDPLNGGEMGFIQFYLDAAETRCELYDSTFYPGTDPASHQFEDEARRGGGGPEANGLYVINRNKGSLIKNIEVGGDFGTDAYHVEMVELQDINAFGQIRFGTRSLDNDYSETCDTLRIRGVLKAGGDVQIDDQMGTDRVKDIKAAIYAGGDFTISGKHSGTNASLVGGVMARGEIRVWDLHRIECDLPTLASLPPVPGIAFGTAKVEYFTGERRY